MSQNGGEEAYLLCEDYLQMRHGHIFGPVKIAPVPEVCLFENGKERKRYPNLLDTSLIAET